MERFRSAFYLLFLLVTAKGIPIENPTREQNASNNHNHRIAICYFGLTRSTIQVYNSHIESLFDVLNANNIDFDVFIHTWRLKGKQRVFDFEIDKPINYDEYELLKPNFYRIDDQDEFTDNLDFDKYFYQSVWETIGHSIDGEWLPQLILNHLCALESQKRVTRMVSESGKGYDWVMYVRPDVVFRNKLDINQILDLAANEIAIPNFAHYEGYNDRFAILKYETAPLYGNRIDHIASYRSEHGRIVSEKYVKFICDKNNLNVRFLDLSFEIIRP